MMKEIAVYNNAGSKVGAVEVAVAAQRESARMAYAVSIRSLLQQWRQGTVGFKTRGEVALSGRKPWKQKGTGRARAGTSRSPLWRKGGAVFGPQPRVHKIAISRKQRRLALQQTFAAAVSTDRFFCIDLAFEADKPQVRVAREALKGLNLAAKKVVVFLSFHDTKAYLSFRNMRNVRVVFYDQPNAYDLSNGQNWVFLKKDVNLFTDMVAKWN
jgi:large subunit ribosomal protein L4